MIQVWVAIILLSGVTVSQNPCSLTSQNGVYDLSPLTYSPAESSPSGYSWSDPNNPHTYYINFCEAVSADLTSYCDGSGACQETGTSPSYYYDLGQASTATLTEGKSNFFVITFILTN